MQTLSLGNLGLALKGPWEAEEYRRNDVVTHDDALWGATRDTLAGQEPGMSAAWVKMLESKGGSDSAPDSIPLLTLIDHYLSDLPGCLNLSLDHGHLSRDTFPDAWALVKTLPAALLLDDAAWLARKTADGVVNAFSRGDGAATFRVPYIPGTETVTLDNAIRKHLKMYGAAVDAGQMDIAELVNSLPGKLDAVSYESDAPMRVRAWARVSASGQILRSHNIASVAWSSNPVFTLLTPAPYSDYCVIAVSVGNAHALSRTVSATQFTLSLIDSGNGQSAGPAVINVIACW